MNTHAFAAVVRLDVHFVDATDAGGMEFALFRAGFDRCEVTRDDGASARSNAVEIDARTTMVPPIDGTGAQVAGRGGDFLSPRQISPSASLQRGGRTQGEAGRLDRDDEFDRKRDRSLARGVMRGERWALDEFCSAYLPQLHRFVTAHVSNAADVDDIVQVTLMNAARRIETYRADSTLATWLLAIGRREIARRHANAARHAHLVPFGGDDTLRRAVEAIEATADDPEHAARRRELTAAVHRCLAALPPRYADALTSMYVDGLGSKALGDRLGLSDAAAQSLLARARRAFRAAWQTEATTGRREMEDGHEL